MQLTFQVLSVHPTLPSHLIATLDAERLATLPDFLIFSQLEDVTAVAALLNQPEKLTLLASKKPKLVEMVSLPIVVEALSDCRLLVKLTLSPFFPTLAAAFPSVITDVLDLKPSLVECIPESTLLHLAEPPTINIFTDHVLSTVLVKRPNILLELPSETLASTVQRRPAMVANLPDEVLISIVVDRQDVLPLIPDKDLTALLKLKPSFLSLIVEQLPTAQLLVLVSSRPQLLTSLPPSADVTISNLLKKKRHKNKLLKLMKAMPASILATLASSRPWLIANMPSSALESLVARDDLLPLLQDDHLLNLLSFRPLLLSAFAGLPADRLSPILMSRPALIERLPPSAKPILSSLLLQKDFLKKLPLPLMVELASSPTILDLVTKFSLIQVSKLNITSMYLKFQVLAVHPTLPSHLDISSLLPLLHHIEDPWFRARLPCLAVTSLVQKPRLLSSLPPSVLESVLTSRRLLACLPSSLLEQVNDGNINFLRNQMAI